MIACRFFALAFFTLSWIHGEISISPTDEKILYVGRFDRRDSSGPRCTWPASRVSIRFAGSSLSAQLKTTGKDFLQVVIDGKMESAIELQTQPQRYTLAQNLSAGEHVVDLYKRTESYVGTVQVLGFFLPDDAKLLPSKASAKKIEVIGDSISCGYGNEALDKTEHFSPKTENGYLAYGSVAATLLGADYTCIAWSGKKLWPDNSIIDLYDKTLATDPSSSWDFKEQIPNAVVINLATNDFGKQTPEENGWVESYKTFLGRLRKLYPDAQIYLAIGTMISDWPQDRPTRPLVLKYLNRVVNEVKSTDSKVQLIDFGVQKMENGIGADWHPSLKTNQEMGKQLAAQIAKDLGW
jgi:hypothetical protein